MATKYSDIIQLQDFLPVYDMQKDDAVAWQSFIPTRQFEKLLSHTLTAITSSKDNNSEKSKRKSIWVRGTFGTGKSHASAVVKHLLCDDNEQIANYLSNISDVELRSKIKNLREQKRYFAVTLKGVEKAYDIPRFTLSLQREVKKALEEVSPNFVVKSDYQIAREWIENHRRIFEEDVFPKDEELTSIYTSTEQILSQLDNGDTSTYIAVENAIRENVGSVLDHTGISDWLVEVEEEIERRGIANGLIIFWDEFTSVMDTLKSDRINVLQNIAEKSQANNVFLFLISHRTESQSSDTKGKDINKMSDRFDDIDYSMDTLSTYLIMRHSFTIANEEKNQEYNAALSNVAHKINPVIDFLTDNNQEQKKHISRLFPMHPYTAYLSSEISNFVGSSNRSVIKFMHDGESGFDAFLNNEAVYGADMMMTADTLWDFFYTEFLGDIASSAFTSIYKSFESKVKAKSEDHLRVFKAILLLNALALKFKGDMGKMTPDDNVLRKIFTGDRVEKDLTNILNYLDESKIVVRNVFGQFKITGNAYNQTELNNQRQKAESNHKTSVEVLNANGVAAQELLDIFEVGKTVKRETAVQLFACEENEQLIRNRINKFCSSKPNYMHVAIFLSIDDERRDANMQILRQMSLGDDSLAIVLPDETFSRGNYEKFIDTIATAAVAKSHYQNSEAQEHEKAAKTYVEKWIRLLLQNSYTIYFKGQSYNEGTVEQIPSLLNDKLAVKAFPKGFEIVRYPKNPPMTFFGDKNCPAVIQQVLEAQNRDSLTTYGGQQASLKYLFEDNGNTLIKNDCELSENALAGNSWLVEVCRHMDKCIADAKKKYADRFCLSEILASFIQPPFGMFTSFMNCAAIAFSLRKHKADLFMPTISQPVSDDKLCDMLALLFKKWKEGKSENDNNLMLRFGSPEESMLTKLFIELFQLGMMPGVKASEIKSLDNAKWYIQEYCKKVAKQPLWTLLYAPNASKDLKDGVSLIIKLFEQENPSPEKIKATYRALNLIKFELGIFVTTVDNYNKGFIAFVDSISEAEIKKEWWNEMLAAVDTLPSEIAFRRESDVRQKIVSFYISKIQPPKVCPICGEDPCVCEPVDPVDPPQPPHDYVKEAKDKIKSLNMPNMMWQRLALDLIEQHPELAEFFSKV